MTRTYAIPIRDGRFCDHFGGAEAFAFFDVSDGGSVTPTAELVPPEHGRGVYPLWLRDRGVTTVLAGGIGPRAISIFSAQGIEVVAGVAADAPEALVRSHLAGTLSSTGAECREHGHHDCGHH